MNTRIVVGPHASLSDTQAGVFFAVVAATALGIAGAFAAQGYWLVLPFAGLELAALAAALWVALRRNRYREVIRFEGEDISVEIGRVGRGVEANWRMPRSLTRAWLQPGPLPSSPTRLVLGCGGRELEIGRCLTDEERARLVRRLKELLSPAYRAGGLHGTRFGEP